MHDYNYKWDLFIEILYCCRHPKFWIIGIPYALSTGVYACWSSVLGLNLKPFKHIDEVRILYVLIT